MASGDTLLIFTPYDNEPAASNFAALDLRNLHPVLSFDTTTGETAFFSSVVPRNYATGGITVYVHWASNSTTGTVGWLVAFERIGTAQDLDSDSFAADQTITAATTSGTSGIIIITNVAVTNGANMDSIAVGEAFRLRITRDVANDTVATDAQILCVELKES